MLIQQISVFLENKAGRIHEMAKTLADANINIRALSLADASDFGVVRMIVDNPALAAQRLRDSGLTVALTEVVAVEVDDRPGGFASVMGAMADADINVEYMYAFVEKSRNNAVLIFRLENIKEASKLLLDKGVRLLKAAELLSL